MIYRCPRYGHHSPYGYERGRYGYYNGYYNEGRYPRGYAYGEEGGRYFRYGARHAGSRAFVESRETVSGRRVMTERNEKTTIGRSATKSKPTMEKEQGKAASPVTKGKSEEGRSASPGSAMSKKAMPKKEQPSTTEKGGGPKKGSM